MAKHRRLPGETVAAEKLRLRQSTTPRRRPNLPAKASPKARAAVAKSKSTAPRRLTPRLAPKLIRRSRR